VSRWYLLQHAWVWPAAVNLAEPLIWYTQSTHSCAGMNGFPWGLYG